MDAPVIALSPKLSSHLIERLLSIPGNRAPIRTVAESLSPATRFRGTNALQQDAVRVALMAFGLDRYAEATSLDLISGRETELTRVNILEDSVIEHDARWIPGYNLVQSDLTGRAVFQNHEDRLEVFTANRRPLEHCFGVDLIYLNTTKQNIVMLQYKMLEPMRTDDGTDWIYRPDDKLLEEIRRMKIFTGRDEPNHPFEYRLNESFFYLKFVKRDGSMGGASMITPLGHYEKFIKDPALRGPKKGVRVSYNALDGRYLRQETFLDLLRTGYIGAHSETTRHVQALIEAVLKTDGAVVGAIQEAQKKP